MATSLGMAPTPFDPEDIELLACVICAPNRDTAAEWLGCSSTHLRRRLRKLRKQFNVDTNEQLIVLASVSGSIAPEKVLPFGCGSGSTGEWLNSRRIDVRQIDWPTVVER